MRKRCLIAFALTALTLVAATASAHRPRHRRHRRGNYVRILSSRGDFLRGRSYRNPYWDSICRYSAEAGIDPALVAAVIRVESNNRPSCRSRSGAVGLMQLMPGTCSRFGVSDPYDPDQNIRAGVALIAENLRRYHGDIERALAAYNVGPGHVDDGSWKYRAQSRHYVPAVEGFFRTYKSQ